MARPGRYLHSVRLSRVDRVPRAATRPSRQESPPVDCRRPPVLAGRCTLDEPTAARKNPMEASAHGHGEQPDSRHGARTLHTVRGPFDNSTVEGVGRRRRGDCGVHAMFVILPPFMPEVAVLRARQGAVPVDCHLVRRTRCTLAGQTDQRIQGGMASGLLQTMSVVWRSRLEDVSAVWLTSAIFAISASRYRDTDDPALRFPLTSVQSHVPSEIRGHRCSEVMVLHQCDWHAHAQLILGLVPLRPIRGLPLNARIPQDRSTSPANRKPSTRKDSTSARLALRREPALLRSVIAYLAFMSVVGRMVES